MATSWTKMLCLTLLVLSSLQGCCGEDQDSVESQEPGNWTTDCQQPHLEEIKELVQEFNNNDSDWKTLITGLHAVIDNSSVVFRQLEAKTVYGIGISGYTQLASLLVCAGLPVDTPDSAGDTMLCGAATGGRLQLLKLLLDRGAAVDARNHRGGTALMWAAYAGRLEEVKWLVRAGADTTARDNEDQTALDWAKLHSYTPVVRYLEHLPH